jgi:hypothetical protein
MEGLLFQILRALDHPFVVMTLLQLNAFVDTCSCQSCISDIPTLVSFNSLTVCVDSVFSCRLNVTFTAWHPVAHIPPLSAFPQ